MPSSVRGQPRPHRPRLLNRLLLRWGSCVVGPLLAMSVSPRALAQTGICPAQLPSQIHAILDQPDFQRARWGVLVQTLAANPSQRQTLYDYDAQRLFIPASNVKLFTTAAALQRLGSQHIDQEMVPAR